MGNDKYHDSMERNRQELSQERMAELSRRARQAPKAKSKGLLLPSLFFIFILIPVTLLIYVAFYYEPDDTLTAKTNENEVSFELNSQPPASETVLAASEETPENDAKDAQAKEAAEQKELKEKASEREEQEAAEAKEQEQVEAKEQAAAKEQAEQQAKETALAEQQAREAAEAKEREQEQAKQQAEAKKKEQAEAKKKEQETKPETPTAGGKTIVVQSSETLYRIAVNNYGASGAAAAVEKIKQANGLASNSISPGQTLILP